MTGNRVKLNSTVQCVEWDEHGVRITSYPYTKHGLTIYHVLCPHHPPTHSLLSLFFFLSHESYLTNQMEHRILAQAACLEESDGLAHAHGKHSQDKHVV